MAEFLPKEQNISWGPPRGPWVREIDPADLEIDWDRVQRYEEWRTTRTSDARYRGAAATEALHGRKQSLLARGEATALPGYTEADVALNECFSRTIPPLRFMGPQQARTPRQFAGAFFARAQQAAVLPRPVFAGC